MNTNAPPCAPSRPWLAPLLIFVIAFAGMSRIAANSFVDWDDSFTLYANPKMNPPTAQTLTHYWTTAEHGLYMPATQTIWAALAKLAYHDQPDDRGLRLSPRVFHMTSITLHATAALVAFLLLRRLFASDLPCAIGALLFALHPVQVESVAWASGMKDLLCGLFSLIALWQYIRAAQLVGAHASPWEGARTFHYTIATAAFALALLCKPAAMVLPALAVVIHIALLRATWKTALQSTALWWPMSIVIMIVARLSQPITIPGPALWQRPLVALDAIAFYLGKLIAPLNLCIDYGRTPDVAAHSFWWTSLIPLALAAIIAFKPRRQTIAAALIGLICLSPMLGLTPFMFQIYSTVSDHYLYLAMLAPALALAWLVTLNPPYTFTRPAACILLALFAIKSFAQQHTWRDDETLFSHTLATNPNSFMAANNLAAAYQNAGNMLLFNAPLAAQLGDRATAELCRSQARANYLKAAEFYTRSIAIRRSITRGIDNYANPHIGLAETQAKLKELNDSPASASTD